MSNKNEYGDDWPNIRQHILERDEFTCAACKKSGVKLVVHHDRPIKMGGKNDDKNLWALCRQCHADVHAQINSMVKRYGAIGLEFFLDEKKYAEFMGPKK